MTRKLVVLQRIQIGFHRGVVDAQELVGGGHHVDTVGLALRAFLVHELVDRLIHWSALQAVSYTHLGYLQPGWFLAGGACRQRE